MTEKTNDADRPSRPDVPRTEFESLHAFQRVMYDKLAANRHKGGWSQDPIERLVARLKGEVVELEKAIEDWKQAPDDFEEEIRARKVARESADVANFAMMVADRVGGLPT